MLKHKTTEVKIIHDVYADKPYRISFPRDRDKPDVYRKTLQAALNVQAMALMDNVV